MTYVDPLSVVGVAHQTPKGAETDHGVEHVSHGQYSLLHVGTPLLLFRELRRLCNVHGQRKHSETWQCSSRTQPSDRGQAGGGELTANIVMQGP